MNLSPACSYDACLYAPLVIGKSEAYSGLPALESTDKKVLVFELTG
tara:strand:+ start:161 stop:298 length:138 start_codon:yes stop_codon:yes gene_type:complete